MLQIPIQPMLLEKSDAPPIGNYVRQLKWDGFRCLIHFDSTQGIRLITRHGTDCTLSFPELQKLPSTVKAAQFILDGEMVVIQEDGYSDWEDVCIPEFTRIKLLNCYFTDIV
jgi:DNA ligase 1